MGNGVCGRWMGEHILSSPRTVFKPLCSEDQGLQSAQEDYRTRFYEMYRHEAEDYDREFIKKYDEDLNTTLIFVSFFCCPRVNILTGFIGWSVLRRDFCVYHSGPAPTPAGPKPGGGRAPPCHPPQDG